jgi:hypothetical protein
MANFIIWATPGISEIAKNHYNDIAKKSTNPSSHSYQSLIWHRDRKIDDKEFNHIPRWYRSLGPYQLATWLRNHGYTVKVIDFCLYMTVDQLVGITEKHIDSSTLAIGASTTFWQIYETTPPWIAKAKKDIENKFKNIKWCLGGHGSNRFKSDGWEVLEGEGENIVLKWLDEISDRKIYRKPFDILQSSNMFMPDDFIQSYEFLPVELGRGCMFKCKFCQYPNIGKKPGTYLKNYQCLYEEILDHYNKWGTTRFYYTDDTVNESEEKIQALADIAQKLPFKLEWIGYLRADLIWSKPHTSQLLKDSGLRSAFFGIESFERKSSLLIGKGWSGLHAKDWLLEQKQRWKDEINWSVATIVGIPGQTPEQLFDDCDWLIKNNMYWSIFHALHINPAGMGKIATVSEFERNYQEYGFTFPDPINYPWYWENGDWNYALALQVTDDLSRKGLDHHLLSSWTLGEYASLGYSVDEIINRPHNDFVNNQEVFTKAWNFIESYVTKNLL